MLFRQVIHEDLGCASYLVGDAERGGRRGGRPAVGHRALPAAWPPARGADRARARDPQPRRPRLRPRPPRPRHRGDDPHPRAGRRRVPARGLRRRLDAAPRRRSRSRRSTRPATGPSTPPSCSATRDRGGEPWARADRRLAVRRRRRPPRPRGRAARGRRRDLPLPARAAAGAARRRRGLARAPRRLALRQLGHRPQVVLDDRLRARATTARCGSPDEAEFVEDAVATLGDRPPNVEHIVALNRGPLVEELGTPAPLSPRAVEVGDRRAARCSSTRAPTSSSTRPTSRARSAPPPTTPASRPRSPRSSRRTSS